MGRNEFESIWRRWYEYYQAILLLNIASGTFVQSAADSANCLQDTLDGNESV